MPFSMMRQNFCLPLLRRLVRLYVALLSLEREPLCAVCDGKEVLGCAGSLKAERDAPNQ